MKDNSSTDTLINLANNQFLPIIEQKVKTFKPQYIQTFNYEIQQELQQKFDTLSNEETFVITLKEIIEELKAVDFQKLSDKTLKEVSKQRKELAKADYRAELLYQLIEEADKISPLLPFIILNRKPFIPHLENIIKPVALLKECENLEGEPKAEKAADFYHDVAERVYDNYVRVIWELCCVIRGKKQIKSFDTFGNTIRNLQTHLPPKYHDLIDFDASWYRNTTAHKSRRYLPAEKVLLLFGEREKMPYSEKICANCLQSMAEDIYWMSGEVLFQISTMYLRKDMQIDSGFMKVNMNVLKSFDFDNPDETKINQHEVEIKKLFKHWQGYQIIRKKQKI
jgi:hypothetical protein